MLCLFKYSDIVQKISLTKMSLFVLTCFTGEKFHIIKPFYKRLEKPNKSKI